MQQLSCFWHVWTEEKKIVKKSLQPTQNSRHTSCLCMCTLWHVEFLNEQECVHKRLSSPLHLGTLHDVFVQMISRARRQPNYLSSSVSSEPKHTSTLAHTHQPVHIPQGCLSATMLHRCVMEAITLLLSASNVELVVFSSFSTLCLIIWTLWYFVLMYFIWRHSRLLAYFEFCNLEAHKGQKMFRALLKACWDHWPPVKSFSLLWHYRGKNKSVEMNPLVLGLRVALKCLQTCFSFHMVPIKYCSGL